MKEWTEEILEREDISYFVPSYEEVEETDNEKIGFSLFSDFLYYGIAFPVLNILTKVVFDLKIEGREQLEKIKGGAISVSNHIQVLDCAMVGLAWGKRKVTYTTQEESFQIPVVRKLIKALNAIPIPKGFQSKKAFRKEVNHRLKQKNIVHFYPEASLLPYCMKIRDFQKGAFTFAIENKVPIVPMVFHFRSPEGIRKIWKKKPDITLTILEPILKVERFQKEELKQMVKEKMEDGMKKGEKEKT